MALGSQRQRQSVCTKVLFQWWMRQNVWGLYLTGGYPLYHILNMLKRMAQKLLIF